MEIVDTEQPPLRAFLGSTALDTARVVNKERLHTCARWNHIAKAAHGARPPVASARPAVHLPSAPPTCRGRSRPDASERSPLCSRPTQ
ncbi:hypothetical protein [Streptomyces sp. TE33382]